MNQDWNDRERPRGYYAGLILMLLAIMLILLPPVFVRGTDQLPYAILMSAFMILPILGCGLPLGGRPLFQFHYHGTLFNEEVMDISDDERAP